MELRLHSPAGFSFRTQGEGFAYCTMLTKLTLIITSMSKSISMKKWAEGTDGTMAGEHNSALLSYRMLQTVPYQLANTFFRRATQWQLTNKDHSYKSYQQPTRTNSLSILETEF